MNTKNDDIAGKRLTDVDRALLNETLTHLRAGDVSPAFFVPSVNEIALICERLANARIRNRCGCGQSNCRTYYFDYPEKPYNVGFRTIRFFTRGDVTLHVDSEGYAIELEHLSNESAGPTSIYARGADEKWVAKVV